MWDSPGSNQELLEISKEEPFENITQAVVYLEDPSRRKNKSERLERGTGQKALRKAKNLQTQQ